MGDLEEVIILMKSEDEIMRLGSALGFQILL